MTCPSCTHENRPGAKFCRECGTPLQQACSKCGSELPPDVKFCDECGTPASGAAPVARPAEPAGARKIVTILFADLVGSTGLHERLDPESARRFMESYYAAARQAVEGHGGTVTQFLGDGVKAVFGIPRVAEDDAIRAVRAGVAMQEAFHALAEQQRSAVGETGLRVAVNTGEVVVKGETEIIGDPVNVAARLQERGRDGDVVIGESTRRLVASQISLELLGSFDLKGRAEAVKAYRVVSLDAPGRAAKTAFVGREEELARITAVYDRAVETPAAHLAVLLGSPGLGKSRLIGEFARRRGEIATVVAAHCDAAGGATFAPLADALRELLAGGGDGDHLPLPGETVDKYEETPRQAQGERKKSFEIRPDTAQAELVETSFRRKSTVSRREGEMDQELRTAIEAVIPGEDTERARIAAGIAGILAGAPGAPEETFFVVRRFLAGLARKRPVVLMIDDLQWAEPLLLDLVEHLVQWGRGLPLLVLIGARPELREVRSSFAMPGGLVADVVTLAGLDAGVAMRLAAGVIGATDLPAAVAAKVLATSEGNPLFIGELVRMLVDEGALIRDGDRWKTGDALATVEMPPTIHALLGARIERLEPQQCAVLERAAVVGRQFSRSAVAALLPSHGVGLDAQLESLQRAQLIERDTGWLLGEPVLRFHHVLIRDAAYRRLLKGTRAELHERLANWIEERVGDAPEHDETIGRHLEEAHRLLGELGPVDDEGQRLGERAATRLAAAGRHALEGDDAPLAAGLLGRALDRLGRDDPARADLALDWCEALLSAGDVTGAVAAIEELGRLAEDKGLGGYGVTGLGVGSDSSLTPNPLASNPLRLQAWHSCFVGHHTVLTAPQELSVAVELVAAAATSLASLNDTAGEAKAHFVHALALSRLGRVGACEASLDQALAAARRAGDRRRANTVLAIAPLAALWGPSPVTRASGRCLDVVRVLRITQGAPAVEAVALSCQGVLEALRGRTEAAHRMIASGRKMVEELGIAQRLFETDVFAGFVALLEDDASGAEQTLRGAYEGLRDLGFGIDAARAAALLGRALLAQDRSDHAEALSHESEALAGDDLKAAIAWRGVRAEALARRGEHGAAIELAKAALEIAAATDALLDHADARLALAAALRAAGRGAEADAEERRAIELWERKGAMLLVERAQQRAAKPVRPDRGVDLPADKPPPFDPSTKLRAGSAQGRPGPLLGKEGVPERRLRPNAASALMKGIEAGFAARDPSAIEALLSDPLHTVEHPTGATYEREGQLESIERMLRLPNLEFRIEVLATLGEALCLGRRRVTASGTAGGRFDVAEYEMDHVVLSEVDESGRLRWSEVFATDHLGDAIHRLYERYTELLPEGPARERAETVARVVRMSLTPFDVDPAESLIDPGIEIIDHRNLGSWDATGARAVIQQLTALHDVARDAVVRNEDILALEPNALLVRRLHSGTERVGGAIYERQYYILGALGRDGRLNRVEFFDVGDEARALTCFDQLTVESSNRHPTQRPSRRAVRANAATRISEGFKRTINARDPAALERWLADDLQFEHWPTGASYGAREFMTTWRGAFRAKHLELELEVIAGLGDRMAVHRHQVTVEGVRDSAMADFGRAEFVEIVVVEADDFGKCRRMDLYAPEKLGDAIARLYERHAELLETGPAHERAATTARTVAMMVTRSSDHKTEDVIAPDLQLFDHSTVGQVSARGYDLVSRFLEAWEELTDDRTIRVEDVLGLSENAFLRRSTISGTVRASGGPFESSFLVLSVFGPDGRQSRTETFEVGHEAEARARFEQLTVASEDRLRAPRPARRRVRANRASTTWDRHVAAINARDVASLEATFSDGLVYVHHVTGTTFGKPEIMSTWLGAFQAEHLANEREVLATLGDSLVLGRNRASVSGLIGEGFEHFGPAEMDSLVVAEDRGAGFQRAEEFAPDRLGHAIVRLYELYAAQQPAGPARTRLEATAQAISTINGPVDLERMTGAYAADLRLADHRILATWSCESAAELMSNFRHQLELAADFAASIDDIVVLETDALLVRVTYFGTGQDSGGAFENRICVLYRFGDDGRIAWIDCYEAEHEAEALACFDELTSDRPPLPRPVLSNVEGGDHRGIDAPPERGDVAAFFANSAVRAMRRVVVAQTARDIEAIAATFADDFRGSDRRSLLRADTTREEYLEAYRSIVEMTSEPPVATVMATRGARLALVRWLWRGAGGDVGPSEIEMLHVIEVDDRGDHVAVVTFDATDIDAAYAELDARYEAGEAATPSNNWLSISGFVRAVERRDWGAVRALCREDFVEHDHRGLAVLGGTEGADAWVDNFRTLVELAPDTVYRAHHLLEAERGYFVHGSWYGTREGGPYELQVNAVLELDDAGRFRRADMYDDAVTDAALARLAELADPVGPSTRFDNTATRLNDRFVRAWAARDWNTVSAAYVPEHHVDDRRRLMQMRLPGGEAFTALRFLFDVPGSRWVVSPLATRGENLALSRYVFEGTAAADAGPLAIDYLAIDQTNADGRFVETVLFDPDDVDTADAELDARYEAEQGDRLPASWTLLRRWVRAVAERDWEAVAAVCSDDFVEHDHRSLSLLGVTRGVGPWIQVVRTVSDLAPDSVFRIHHFIPGARGYYEEGGFCGTREGGPFEIVINALVEIDDHGLLKRVDTYDDDRVFTSPRWAELGIPVPSTAREPADLDAPGPPVAEANAACAAMEGWREAYRIGFETGNWELMRQGCAPGCVFDDRRRMALLVGDAELMVASARERAAAGAQPQLTLVGTAGDRVVTQRLLWSGSPPDGRFEIEYIGVSECDEAGRGSAYVLFDLEDALAAQREAWARWAAIDPEMADLLEVVSGLADAFNEHDRQKVRALCDDELVYHDRRRTGVGRIDGADAAIASIEEYWKLAGNQELELGWHWPAYGRHGGVTVVRRFGTLPDGGAFESEYLEIFAVAHGRATHLELFEMEDLDAALARFEELCGPNNEPQGGRPPLPRPVLSKVEGWNHKGVDMSADQPPPSPLLGKEGERALRIPPNEATRLLYRIHEVRMSGGIDALRGMVTEDFRFEDRKKVAQVVGGVEEWVRALDFLWNEAGARVARAQLLATAGDRLALDCVWWRETPGEGPFEIENYRLIEADSAGKLRAMYLFDAGDRVAAHEELFDRYVALGAEGMPQDAIEYLRGWNAHDLVRARGGITDDFVLDDHRRTGMGRLEGADRYIESVAALHELIPDARADGLYNVAVERHGRVSVSRTWGHNREGGEVESPLVVLMHHPGEKLSLIEFFDFEHLDAALARFKELPPSSSDTTLTP